MTAEWIMIGILVLIFGLLVYADFRYRNEKKEFESRLLGLLTEGKFVQFDEMIASADAQKFLRPFNRMFLKMNKEVIAENHVALCRLFDDFLHLRMNRKQKTAVAAQMLPFFAIQRDAERCCACKNLLVGVSGCDNLKTDADRICRILKDGDTSDFDSLLSELQDGSSRNRFLNEFLAAEICRIRGDAAAAGKFAAMAKQDLQIR